MKNNFGINWFILPTILGFNTEDDFEEEDFEDFFPTAADCQPPAWKTKICRYNTCGARCSLVTCTKGKWGCKEGLFQN